MRTLAGVAKVQVYETWLDRQVLLPLLDGLDELGLVRQKQCTEQINQFAASYPQLVVCCRVKEFRLAGVKLSNLRGAVQLQQRNQVELLIEQLQPSWLTRITKPCSTATTWRAA
ncbi:MAG: hypothetical protein HC805_06400 [Alkalinema sp. RL_2_19]|nr:hypothetical protein [Alkalinema sp. RL_2_19]